MIPLVIAVDIGYTLPKGRERFKSAHRRKGVSGMALKDQHCVEISKGTPALDEQRIAELLAQLTGWRTNPPSAGQHRTLRKRFSFTDFLGAMAFVDRLAALAEEEQHHPDFSVHYNEVDVSLWTHTVGGLSENDFILAAKLDSLF